MKAELMVGSILRKMEGAGLPFEVRCLNGIFRALYLDSGSTYPLDQRELEFMVRLGKWVVVHTPKEDKVFKYIVVNEDEQAQVFTTKQAAEYEINALLSNNEAADLIRVFKAEEVSFIPFATIND